MTALTPELKTIGTLIRFFLPRFSEKKFRRINQLTAFLLKGKCRSRNLIYQEESIARSDGGELRICVYRPKERRENVPGLLWMHGGGYAIGLPEQDEGYIRRFIEESGCVVVSPDYRLSAEAPFPAALEDCCTALRWLHEHGAAYGVRSDQLFIGGGSAGGGLTAAVALCARDRGDVAVAFQMPLYPMIDDRLTESSADNDAPVWNSQANELAWKMYLGDRYQTDAVSSYAAPSRETDYAGLPPTFTFVGSVEPFRDETAAYVEALKASGIPVHFKIYEGCFHAFDLIGAWTRVGKDAEAFMMDTFRYARDHYFSGQPCQQDGPESSQAGDDAP